jgi:CDP-diacylglycerol--glycerol-3-phosphate 3-phosphatidyltransferase
MMANWVTLARIPLLAVVVMLLYAPEATLRLSAPPLILVLILMDTLDGVIARARNETSVLGSMLDIASDRAVEYALWMVFAHLRLIPVFIPLTVLVRGTFVDTFRSLAPRRGVKPFDLLQRRVGRFLVASPFMRTSYAVTKATAFVLLSLAHASAALEGGEVLHLTRGAQFAAWLALALCLARGIPVLIEAPGVLQEPVVGG